MHVDLLEAVWIVLNVTTSVLTLAALLDARADRAALLEHNGPARLLVVNANIRREYLHLAVQVLLLLIVVPGLFSERPVSLSPFVLILMAMSVVLLVSTLLDARDRRTLARLVADG